MRKCLVFLIIAFGFTYNSAFAEEVKTCTVAKESVNNTDLKTIEVFNEHSLNSSARITLYGGQQAMARVKSSFWGYSISITPSECEKLPKIRLDWPSELCRTFSVVKENIFGKKYGIVLYENGYEGRFDFIFNNFTCEAK